MSNRTEAFPSATIAERFRQVAAALDGIENRTHTHRADTFLCLASEAVFAYGHLLEFSKAKNLQYSAFTLRNLLELAVWAEYCAQSKKNADRFLTDTIRDVSGLLAALSRIVELAQNPPHDWDSLRIEAESSIRRASDLAGIQEYDSK